MRAADEGELYDRGQVEAQVQRMLKDPRAIQRSQEFISQWLNLEPVEKHATQPRAISQLDSGELAADMREETLQFFKHIVWDQQRPLSDLLNAQITFATPRLAKHYGCSRSRPKFEAV